MCTTTHLTCTRKCTPNMHGGAQQKLLYHMSSYAHLTHWLMWGAIKLHSWHVFACCCWINFSPVCIFPLKSLIKHPKAKRQHSSNKDKLRDDDHKSFTIHNQSFHRILRIHMLSMQICYFHFSDITLKSYWEINWKSFKVQLFLWSPSL